MEGWRAALLHLRIPFSYFLTPLFFLALTHGPEVGMGAVGLVFLIWHFFVYPASNAFNSYMDQDEGPIGGLEKPPKAGIETLIISNFFDFFGIVLALTFDRLKLQLRHPESEKGFMLLMEEEVHQFPFLFTAGVLLYILASRAYSSKWLRLKKYPFAGFLTVVVFQGLLTFVVNYSAFSGLGWASALGKVPFLVLAAGFMLGGSYPITQIYQHQEDQRQGVRSLSQMLGIQGTFVFSGLMFLGAAACLFLYYSRIGQPERLLYLLAFLAPVGGYLLYWFRQVRQWPAKADFAHTMRFNLVAATAMNAYFLVYYFLLG